MADRVALSGLTVRAGARTVVAGAGLSLSPGRVHVLVGASGSGKTMTARALLGLVRARPGVIAAELLVQVGGQDHRPYTALSQGERALDRAFRPIRGAAIGYLAQDARASLDPLRSVGGQLAMCLKLAGRPTDPLPWLRRAGFPDAARVAPLYPHELSGGMAQRASIALSIARGSRFLVADEPTTGLDPTVQEAILGEVLRLRDDGVGVLFITHDLRLVPRIADRLLVMHEGRIVEDRADVSPEAMEHEAARRLWQATARIGGQR